MKKNIALIGNPNSGKTTLFNALTGGSQRVGNWPGVTVEKKEGKLRQARDVTVTDLPGVYSLSPYSPEEEVSRRFLAEGSADAVINVVDATNLERNLILTLQLLEMGIPVTVALNMSDVVERRGDTVDEKKLSERLGCPVIRVSALKREGLENLAATVLEQASYGTRIPKKFFKCELSKAISEISGILEGHIDDDLLYWYSIKVMEHDPHVPEALPSPVLERALETVRRTEDSLGDDGEAIVASARYEVVDSLVRGIYQKSEKGGKSVTDRIDEVVTNRWLAIPIFAAVMFLVYYLSITSVGGYMTDWVNETVFEENVLPRTADWLAGMGVEDWLVSLIVNGIITGVGAVLGFLPQLLVLFLLLALLEDSGYMARIAFVMDRILRRFGLSGKSFIPIIVGTGCAVPGIMASRTIEDERDRKITAMTTSFMPCSAKLPVIALISGALFGGSAWIAVSVYFIGVFSILVSGVILKKIRGAFGKASPFVMELPDYHVPSARNVVLSMGDRSWHFVKKAGTIIVLASGLIWLLTSYDWSLNPVGAESSMLASIGNALSPAFSPLGWGDWRAVVGTLSGLVAKENILSTFGILFGMEVVAEDGAEIWTYMATIMSPLAGFSFLLFNMLCAPCFAAIGAMRRELGSWKETGFAVGYQCAFAYVVAFAVYQFGLAIQGTPSFWLIPAALLVIGTGYLFFRNPGEPEDEVPAEAA